MSSNKHPIGFFFKACFDRIGAFVGLLLISPLLLIVALLIKMDSKGPVFFLQTRIGQHGKKFKIIKFRSMYQNHDKNQSTVSVLGDSRITPIGKRIRKHKIDNLPELFNVLIGQMSFVGPRPDVEGYADKLEGENRQILDLKPGITGIASLKYRNEETLLAHQEDPIRYNDEVIYPDKVRLNLEYCQQWSFWKDLAIIAQTIFGE